MSKNVIIGIIVAVIVAFGGYYLFTGKKAVAPSTDVVSDSETGTYPVGTDIPDADLGAEGKRAATIITFTDAGYSPTPVTIKVGDTVTFKNESSVDFWPASAMHPTHTVYPGSDIKKCGTEAEPTLFDACRGIKPGGDWSFTFTEVGTWNFHDHLISGKYGRIVVE